MSSSSRNASSKIALPINPQKLCPMAFKWSFGSHLGQPLEAPTLLNLNKHCSFSLFSKSHNFAHGSSFWTTLATFLRHLLQKAQNLGSQWVRDWPGNASFWSPETTWALHAPKSPHKVPKSAGNGSKCLQKELKNELNTCIINVSQVMRACLAQLFVILSSPALSSLIWPGGMRVALRIS